MTALRTPETTGSIDSTELRMLHALATTGSLTQTAALLGLSQPAVSQRLKRVETRLSVPLIERQGRGIRLTQAGEILAEHGRNVTAEIDAALAAIEALRGERGGVLRMAGFPSASATIVPQLMRKLADEAPGVTFQYREAEPPQAIEMLRNGDVDCAFIFDYTGNEPLPAACHFEPFWREELWMVAPVDRVDDIDLAILEDFRDDHWIAGCERCRGHLLGIARSRGFEPDIIQESDNMPAVIAMVAAGSSVAMVPGLALAGPSALPEGARALRMSPPQHRMLGLVCVETVNESPAVRLAKRLLGDIDGSQWGLTEKREAVGSGRSD